MHPVDVDALRADPLGLGQIAAKNLRGETDSRLAAASVGAVRLHPVGSEPGLATLLFQRPPLTEYPQAPGQICLIRKTR